MLAGWPLTQISKTDTQLVLELQTGQSYPEGARRLVVGAPETSYEDDYTLTLKN